MGLADASDIAAAAAAAKQAQPEWGAQPGPQRAALIRRAARILEDNRAEFERWLVREGGAIPGKAAFEVELVLGELWEAAALPTRPWGHLLPTSEAGRQSMAKRVPLGVVGVISPWNFPLILSTRAVAPALAPGNAVILKPDAQTAVSGGILLARLFEVAGLAPGLLHVLPGDAEPGAALAESPDVAMISFTGSTAVGLYYRPTVLADVTPGMAAFREEIFGPVAPVVVVKDVDEAVRTANATEYGLVAAIQTGSMERGLELAERLNTGIVHVNDQTLNNDAYAPFGRTGASGNGSRFGSQSGWDEFTQWQWVTARPQAHGFPF